MIAREREFVFLTIESQPFPSIENVINAVVDMMNGKTVGQQEDL